MNRRWSSYRLNRSQIFSYSCSPSVVQKESTVPAPALILSIKWNLVVRSFVVVVFYVPTYLQYYSTVQYCTVLLYLHVQ